MCLVVYNGRYVLYLILSKKAAKLVTSQNKLSVTSVDILGTLFLTRILIESNIFVPALLPVHQLR